MAFPVLNTFIHYSVTRQTRRCRSSPPEVQVHLALPEAVAPANSRTPRRRRRRRAAATGDDQTLSEYRHLAICENWRLLAQRAAIQYRREVRIGVDCVIRRSISSSSVPSGHQPWKGKPACTASFSIGCIPPCPTCRCGTRTMFESRGRAWRGID